MLSPYCLPWWGWTAQGKQERQATHSLLNLLWVCHHLSKHRTGKQGAWEVHFILPHPRDGFSTKKKKEKKTTMMHCLLPFSRMPTPWFKQPSMECYAGNPMAFRGQWLHGWMHRRSMNEWAKDRIRGGIIMVNVLSVKTYLNSI